MRVSRKIQLPQSGGIVHKIWRAHNRDFLLADSAVKELYLKNIFLAIKHKTIENQVSIHAYCIMSNHVHESVSYSGSSQKLSAYMRVAHGKFGAQFNRIKNRQGPVAYDRPKTPLIQRNIWNQMRVHFYIEANPLRAKMVRNLKLYAYSSFRFYAWGIEDQFSSALTLPEWYINLGSTPKARQSRYRAFFNAYLSEILNRSPSFTSARFIGNAEWIITQTSNFKKALRCSLLSGAPP